MFNFERLLVYQKAINLANVVYRITKSWPKDELFGLVSQLRRAIVSIALNIGEGSSRTKKEFRHFLDQARGSCYEAIAIITIAKNQKFISEAQFKELYQDINEICRSINALKNSLR